MISKKWLQYNFGWIPTLLDWADKQLQRARIVGIITTATIGITHYETCTSRDKYLNHERKLQADSLKLAKDNDSLRIENINLKYHF